MERPYRLIIIELTNGVKLPNDPYEVGTLTTPEAIRSYLETDGYYTMFVRNDGQGWYELTPGVIKDIYYGNWSDLETSSTDDKYVKLSDVQAMLGHLFKKEYWNPDWEDAKIETKRFEDSIIAITNSAKSKEEL